MSGNIAEIAQQIMEVSSTKSDAEQVKIMISLVGDLTGEQIEAVADILEDEEAAIRRKMTRPEPMNSSSRTTLRRLARSRTPIKYVPLSCTPLNLRSGGYDVEPPERFAGVLRVNVARSGKLFIFVCRRFGEACFVDSIALS